MGVNIVQLADGSWNLIDDITSKNLLAVKPHGSNFSDFASRFTVFDDFFATSVSTNWTLTKGSDAACINFSTGGSSGEISGVAYATMGAGAGASMAANGVQINLNEPSFKASQGNLVFETKVKLQAITNVALFVGFTDQVGSLEMPATLGGSDALTTNFTDGCGFLFDTAADTDNWWAIGVANDVDATKQNTGIAPTAGTYETFRVEVNTSGVATFYRNGVVVGTPMTGATRTTIALTPVIAGFRRTNASTLVYTDYILAQQDR